jgi:hypothetical protein
MVCILCIWNIQVQNMKINCKLLLREKLMVELKRSEVIQPGLP